ncbi:MAG: AAA family ATPase [Rhodocyclaceae bacterium]|nr:AAA family ATPase [Rhodocyclaceae bacterium]
MYLTHFGLDELPFSITPDTQFTCAVAAHEEALNTLLLAIHGGEGFIKITGEVGVGKTLLCRKLLSLLGDEHVVAYLPNPQLQPRAMLGEVAAELGADSGRDASMLVKAINRRVLDIAAQGRTAVLLIDEAQMMSLPTLQTLRMLSNLETEKSKLIQIVLFGQPELDELLAEKSARQVLQRISFHYRMPGLARHEVDIYLQHRLRVAGLRGPSLFSRAAHWAIYRHSKGLPRLVNVLAHKALLSAFGEGAARAGYPHVRRAVKDTESAFRRGWM